MKKHFLTLILSFIALVGLAQEHPYAIIKGIWEGKLHISNTYELTTVMVVKENGDSVHVELDSPDQYSTGIQLDGFSYHDSIIHFTIRPLAVTFDGRLTSATTISGTFTQANRPLPLNLTKTDYRKQYLRPQTPEPPYPYEEKFINIDVSSVLNNDLAKVKGTLTLPKQTPKATVIMISGSGWQDRDETIYNHHPFQVIADHLTRVGYAVFRYDDLPTKVFVQSTTLDFANVAEYILNDLSQREELKGTPIGFIGHSEGALVASIVASRNENVAFVISLAGMAQKLSETLLYQSLCLIDSNASKKSIDTYLNFNNGLYKIMEKEKDIKKASTTFLQYVKDFTKDMTPAEIAASHLTTKDQFAMSQQLFTPWMMTLFKLDPVQYIKKVKCPYLALNGEMDKQVKCDENLALIRKATKKNASAKCEAFPNLNHLFQTCETGLPDEYGKISQTFNPTVLLRISYWLNSIYAPIVEE